MTGFTITLCGEALSLYALVVNDRFYCDVFCGEAYRNPVHCLQWFIVEVVLVLGNLSANQGRVNLDPILLAELLLCCCEFLFYHYRIL